MRRKLAAIALLLPVLAWAGGPVASSMNAWRSRSVADPHGLIAQLRDQLDTAGPGLAPTRERSVLWGMGTAAINANDDAALAEATLRLHSLGNADHDPVALAAAGYLRARHDIANGIGEGLTLALQAAARVQEVTDPQIVAWSRFQLCDAYALDEQAKKALPLCRQSLASYTALADRWGIADAENDLGIVLATLNRVRDAAAMYQRSRRDFATIGADELVVMVGDNLSPMYLKMGRAREALALSKASLAQELADGRISDSLGSSTDIARAEAALGHPHKAYAMIQQAVARARAAGMDGELSDVLRVASGMAERIGLLKVALGDVREVLKLNAKTSTPALRAIEAELEQHYATREKELRIHDLERENRINSLALKAAHADAARRIAEQRRADLLGRVSVLAVAGLLLLASLLFLLLRNQRRYAEELRLQALRDPLTGVENRRAFMQRANLLLSEPRNAQRVPHVLMLIDFDHFKRINDSAGHQAGDRVLAMVAEFLQAGMGKQAHLARIGGEEFAVLCPGCDAEAGMRLAETLRAGVATLSLPATLPGARVTVSIGVAVFDGHHCHDLSSWMRATDEALYSAKAHGRDRVVASALVS
ncbi:MAG: GGDEF domain-containing protein [Rhodanobacter sp.]|nr:MAG: GGDEF domain-containing protein [Rhodanobacter sp.]